MVVRVAWVMVTADGVHHHRERGPRRDSRSVVEGCPPVAGAPSALAIEVVVEGEVQVDGVERAEIHRLLVAAPRPGGLRQPRVGVVGVVVPDAARAAHLHRRVQQLVHAGEQTRIHGRMLLILLASSAGTCKGEAAFSNAIYTKCMGFFLALG